MQVLMATTDRGSLTYLAFRNQSPYLKKYVKPTRVCFSNLGSFPKLKLSVSSSSQRQIVPLLASSSFFDHGLTSLAPVSRRKKPVTVKAYKLENVSRTKWSKTKERPEWFWMILSCVPYLISFKMSEIGFYMKPFLEQHGGAIGATIINLIPGPANKLQHNFFMMYCWLGFTLMVKNRNLPHYFRFHLIMGMLLEITMQIIWRTSELFPLINVNMED